MSVQKIMSSIPNDLLFDFLKNRNSPFKSSIFAQYLLDSGYEFSPQAVSSYLKKIIRQGIIPYYFDRASLSFIPRTINTSGMKLCDSCNEYKPKSDFKKLDLKRRSCKCSACFKKVTYKKSADGFQEKIVLHIKDFITDKAPFNLVDLCRKMYDDFDSNNSSRTRRLERVSSVLIKKVSKLGLRYRYCHSTRRYITDYVTHITPDNVPLGSKFCYVCGSIKVLSDFRKNTDGTYYARCDLCCGYPHRGGQ